MTNLLDKLRHRTDDALGKLRGLGDDSDLAAAKALVEELRNEREYD